MENAEAQANHRRTVRLREVLIGLDEASLALGAARGICDELGDVAEEERHDCSMAMGIIEEVGAVIESAAESIERSGTSDTGSPAVPAAEPEERGADG